MLKLTLHTARPGIIIGRGGRGVEDIRAEIERIVKQKVHINVQEIRQPELDAQLVAENVAGQIERRIAFKRGIRVMMSGRLGGAEMSRKYSDREGKIPLHTLRADIDYGFIEAVTASGNIGIKVWVYRGDVMPQAAAPEPRVVERPAAGPEKPRKGWRRVGVRRSEGEEAEAAGEAQPEVTASAPAEEQKHDVDAVQGQVPEATERPSEG
jgi:small subunit ribosomal protein S3